VFRFIEIDSIDRYTELEINTHYIDEQSVIISENVATRIQATVGNELHISLDNDLPAQSFVIKYIIPDTKIVYASWLGFYDTLFGCIFLDKSVLPLLLEVEDHTIWHYLLSYNTFYIDGNIADLQNIEAQFRAIAESHGVSQDFLIVAYSTDLSIHMNQASVVYDGILLFFTVACLFLASVSFIQMLFILVVDFQKDLAVLKCLGMGNIRSMFYIMLESAIYLLPTTILGIALGYATLNPIGENIAIFGLHHFGLQEALLSGIKIILIVFSLALASIVPIIHIANRVNIADILRKQILTVYIKKKILIIFALRRHVHRIV